MHPVLRKELDRNNGLLAIAHLPEGVPRWAVFNASRRGHIERVHPGIYRDTARPVDVLGAAALYTRGRGALSHTTALSVWGLASPTADIHLTVPTGVRLRSHADVKIHIRAEKDLRILQRQGLPIMPVEDAIVDGWPLLTEPDRTGCVFEAVGRRMTLPSRIAMAMSRTPHLRERQGLRLLIDKLVRGCHSPLELFGLDYVFEGLPPFARQVRMAVGGRTYYLDAYAERYRLNVELDGASWHSAPEQRELDLRRDAALATAGIQVVRFSYRRLVSETEAVRAQLSSLLAGRERV
jgi:very-short-patch-repair endonuclease